MEQTQDGHTVRNDRLVGKVAQSRQYADVDEFDRLGAAFVDELGRFFTAYNGLKGYKFEVLTVGDASRGTVPIRAAAKAAHKA